MPEIFIDDAGKLFFLKGKDGPMHSLHLTITGLIQGIGFRPFIYNLAHRLGIRGYVRNRPDAVEILARGSDDAVTAFIKTIKESPPPLARIDSLETEPVETGEIYNDFTIAQSEYFSDAVTDISPDIAVCEHCLRDMNNQPHRIGYPLTNCTLCGPRFSIISAVPYDRSSTTMAPFIMCKTCATEYADPADRRFHAQPIACNNCGPVYTLYQGENVVTGNAAVAGLTANLLEQGAVVAIKGTGGFHLACSPFNTSTLDRLRTGKRRDGKPFALMFRDIAALRKYAKVDDQEARLLASVVRPIVLLTGCGNLPAGVNNRLPTLGAMLPYMPFHHLLFDKLALPALVMTSGNISEEPIVIENNIALSTFAPIADAVVVYNRDIHNRVDDSVCAVYGGQVQILRRSRGFAPSPVNLPWPVDGIAAAGAELKSCFALGKGSKALISQHIGDLKNVETLQFYEEAFERLCILFRVKPRLITHDMHPDYLSTRFALHTGLPSVAVQHHHAHIASCCAEHGIERKVIGVALDGTGYGDDGAIWGGEFLVADLYGYKRCAHLRYVGMPGGDRAAVEPWRMAASYLFDSFGDDFGSMHRSLFPDIPCDYLALITSALQKRINTPQTSSVGRLFDAVAALCGLCNEMTFEAEAALRLEALCNDPLLVEPYSWSGGMQIDLRETIRQICKDRADRVDPAGIATRFHATLIGIITATCRSIRDNEGIEAVVLSGGCFQNRCIFEAAVQQLQKDGFSVYTHHLVPCNDGGVALGQLAVAAHQ